MSKIKNTNQNVTSNYSFNYDVIFGDTSNVPKTGTYVIDKKTGKTILIDKNIPSSVRDKMEPLTSTVGSLNPIHIQKKEV
jgi:hypothetical protein